MTTTATMIEKVITTLNERLEQHNSNRDVVCGLIHNVCEGLRKQIDEMEESISKKLEEEFAKETARLQGALDELQMCVAVSEEGTDAVDDAALTNAVHAAGSELFVIQTYGLVVRDFKDSGAFSKRYELNIERQPSLEWICFKKPVIVKAVHANCGNVYVEIVRPGLKEASDCKKSVSNPFRYRAFLYKDSEADGSEVVLSKVEVNDNRDIFAFKPVIFEPGSLCKVKVKALYNSLESEWSDAFEFKNPGFSICAWKECPEYVTDPKRRYALETKDHKIATKINGGSGSHCTIVGNIPILSNRVTSWDIGVLKSKEDDGKNIYVGVAPSDISQDEYNRDKCGWYFYCYRSELWSGPPQEYRGKQYGLKKEKGKYIRTGDNVGVMMDAANGELSFVVNGVNHGIAYEGIPLDKPLVPCVLLNEKGDSIELGSLNAFDGMENVDISIPTPSNIALKSGASWDSIIITWDSIKGVAFYQIEVDGNKHWYSSHSSTFTKKELSPDTEHSFRVRSVKGNAVSEWSCIVGGGMHDTASFSECAWLECPSYTDSNRKYSLDKKSIKVAIKSLNDGCCTVIGSALVPPNAVTSWNVKVLKSRENNGAGIFVGVAPFDIDKNADDIFLKCGWYYDCYCSVLYSGPPHNYNMKMYGPRKKDGKYVHKKDTIGVVMNTIKGDLSFVLENEYLDVAYEGIPLDKPLVPCALLFYKDDSVELSVKKLEQEVITF